MLIKEMDERARERDLAELNALLQLPYVPAYTKEQIKKTIRNIQSGLKGEKMPPITSIFIMKITKIGRLFTICA